MQIYTEIYLSDNTSFFFANMQIWASNLATEAHI